MKRKAPPSTRATIAAMKAALGWSDYRLAKEAGLTRTTVARYLAGEIDTATEKADAMRQAMNKAAPTKEQ